MNQLERRCLAVTIVGAVGILAVAPAIDLAWRRSGLSAPTVASFSMGALLTWFWLAWRLYAYRGDNRLTSGNESDNPTRDTLGRATAVTLLRGWLIALVAGHLPSPPVAGLCAWIVALLYTTAALLDVVDGRVARRAGASTRLGARLDVVTDATGLFIAPAVGVLVNRLPPWYLLLAFAYPLFRGALLVRAWLALPVHTHRLGPDPRARLAAGVQMGVVATSLYPVLPRWLLFAAATIAMLPTLVLFVREWRIASGHEDFLPLRRDSGGRGVSLGCGGGRR